MTGYRYGPYREGPDPLAPPYDAGRALDELGDDVLAGADPASALRDLLRRGTAGRRGLDDLRRRVRERQQAIRRSGRLDGILEQARALLDTAIGLERAELFADPGDDARMREAELDAAPADPARAIRHLASYPWRSPAAAEAFAKLRDLLRREVLDSQFRGLKDLLSRPDPGALRRVKDMLADLNAMLEADARGEHAQADFDAFMARYAQMFGDRPATLEELVDQLTRRAMAAARLLASLIPGQREELAALIDATLADAGLASQMARLAAALRSRRPELAAAGWPPEQMTGDQPLGLGDATTALADLADLAELEAALGQEYPGARLDDVDADAVRRALGRQAVDDLAALREIERELERQGYLERAGGKLELTPKAVRRLGETALRRVFADLPRGRPGDHDQRDAGQAGEPTGATRRWQFGDEQAIDAAATVRNALLRDPPRGQPVRLTSGDFEVTETERRAAAAVCLLVDLSYSMVLRGTWGPAKQTALALHALVRGQFPQDCVQVIGFSDYARELGEADLASLGWDMVQGTNLHHALILAGRYLDRRPERDPVVLVVTDGEPTAHLRRDGRSVFDWPPAPETLELTLAEVDKMTRRKAALNIFLLADDDRLAAFVDEVARRNGGRVLRPQPGRLGEFVVQDFLRARQGRH
jgi:uncharacterized protein with von Willebrand factor type A (vWA) domain